ncbi:MAG: hypothetical protein RL557_590 [archaeon]|jgi:predicted Asp-tRNA(Asn)/Glu-tRNA(Gln) amidotransferase subunit C
MDREQIEKQAKALLQTFAKALEKVEKESQEESHIEREINEREEGNGENTPEFKNLLLANAPKKNDDFIIAEKGAWK